MTQFNNVFGDATVPSATAKFSAYSLTANQTFDWLYNSADVVYGVTDIMEFSTTAGLSITFPPANQVSVGESALVRNVGSNTLTVLDAAGGTLGTVAAGVAKLFYVKDNTTVAGTWAVITFGTGTSAADATTLQGLGLLAIGATLNDNHPVVTTSAAYTITAANRANTLVFTGGSVNCTLPTLAVAGNGFNTLVKNNGSGTITFVPQGAELIDQLTLAPGESVLVIAGAASWVTVGYGRNTTFAFTRLNKDVTAPGDASISSVEAQNKIINISGTPAADMNVIFPSVAGVYYVSSSLTVRTATLKTATGTGVALAPGDTTIVICDGVNFSIALSATYANNISLPSGTAAAPSLHFAASAGTGLYLPGGGLLGFSANGAEEMRLSGSTLTIAGTMELGRDPVTGSWATSDLTCSGRVLASYLGGAGVSLEPGSTVNSVVYDPTKEWLFSGKNFTMGSTGSAFYVDGPALSNISLDMDSNGWTFDGNVLLGGISGKNSLGFTAGAGGTVNQATSRATAVTLNKPSGMIKLFSAAGSTTDASFLVNNNTVGVNDVIVLSIRGSATNLYNFYVSTVQAGGFYIAFRTTGGTAVDSPEINFVVIKGSTT
jgi:hypothetical protein